MLAALARSRPCSHVFSSLRCYSTPASSTNFYRWTTEIPQPLQQQQLTGNQRERTPHGGATDPKWGAALNDFLINEAKEPTSAESRWEKTAQAVVASLERRPAVTPYSGRSARVTGGNVANAIRQMETILSRNRVKQELRMAERHEKKGYKRRRLASQRWRRLFSHEVRKKVMLVNEIRHRERYR